MRELQTQKEIMHNWKTDIGKPLVSVCCITYNHEPYIEDALNGFLIQETDFAFEILIHDDASTDRTADIIRAYEAKYPDIIKPIYQSENQYSKGIKNNTTYNYPRAQAQYIAFCEGDDYWTDPMKLQKQIDFLVSNPEYNLCFHSAKQITDTQESKLIGQYDTQNNHIPFHKVLLRPYGMIPTASCVFTKKSAVKIQKFLKENKFLKQGDIYLQYISAYDKGALYINEPMSVYRYRLPGSWTQKHFSDPTFRTTILTDKLKSFVTLQKFFNSTKEEYFASLYLYIAFHLCVHLIEIEDKKAKKIEQIFKKIILETINQSSLINKTINLYGASSTTKWMIKNFQNILNINYIIDSDSSKHNLKFEGYLIKHPSKCTENQLVFLTLFGIEHIIIEDLIKKYNFDETQCIYIKHISMNALDKMINEILLNNK